MLRSILFCLIVTLPVCVLAEEIEPIPGDINLDGAVDFADYLILAGNFGKHGPEPEVAKYLTLARKLLGYWRFNGQEKNYYFLIGEMNLKSWEMHDITPLAYGITNEGITVLAGYIPEIEKYSIMYRPTAQSSVFINVLFELISNLNYDPEYDPPESEFAPFGQILHIESDGDVILKSEYITQHSIHGIDVLVDENGFKQGRDLLPRGSYSTDGLIELFQKLPDIIEQ